METEYVSIRLGRQEQDVDEYDEIWDEYDEDDEPGYFHNGKFFWEEEEEEEPRGY